MSLQWMTIASGIRQLWPGRYNCTLAEALGVPRATTKAWVSGKRRMPVDRMRAMAGVLRHDIAVANTTLSYLEVEIARREREPPRRRGFYVIKNWGNGVRCDARWKGGPKR
jgi:hypothetical protein